MRFERILLKRKLMLVILLTSLAVLALTSSAFIIYERLASKAELQDQLEALSDVLAYNASVALAFGSEAVGSKKEAERLLASLRKEEHIVAAAFYDTNGVLFAQYPAGRDTALFPSDPPVGTRSVSGHLISVHEVESEEGKPVGKLLLQSNMEPVHERFRLYTAIGLIVAAISFLLALFLSHLLQKSISGPILKLAGTARIISERRDYTVRAEKQSEDEIGLLTDAFNHMLAQIQDREAAIEEGADRLHLALRASQTGIWDWHIRTNRLIWDESMYRIFGQPEHRDSTFESFVQQVHPDDRDAVTRAIREAVESQREFNAEFRVVWPDGSLHHVSSRGKAIYNEGGRAVRMTGVSIDVSERKKADEARAFLASIVESSEDAIIGKNLDGIVISWNTGAERMFGYTPQEIVGRSVTLLIAPDRSDEESKILGQIRQGHAIEHYETIRLRKNGEPICVSLSVSPIRDARGEIVGVSSISRDTTERRRAEDQIRRLNAELEERVRARTAELTEANQELEAFAYSVSHDLRAPLRHIDAFARILEEELPAADVSPEVAQCVGRIRKGTKTMGQLVDDLLNLSRVGRAQLSWQLTDLNALLQETLADLRPEIANRQIDWRIGILPQTECDPGLVKQVFANLLSNAVKYTRPRPTAVIEIGQTVVDGETAVYVRDNGVGFNMKYLHKLFGVFERLHRLEEFEGTGIGLAIVRRIVQKHGGRVWAEAAPDQGATFYFTLHGLSGTPQA